MTETVKVPEIFNRQRRRLVRDRAYTRAGGRDLLNQLMADEILERLALVTRKFSRCLIIGLAAEQIRDALTAQNISAVIADASAILPTVTGGVRCDEDRLPFADHSFDLVINMGSLDTVNDLPGALTLTRRILMPDGLFLGCFFGAESLSLTKSVLLAAEGDRVTPHIHPQIDVRTIGDLLTRAGLALPVADSDSLKLRYRCINDLVRDIRDLGGSNILNIKSPPMDRNIYQQLSRLFQERADTDGRISEKLELIHLSGWSPHADQPKPARRGSGQISLQSALATKDKKPPP